MCEGGWQAGREGRGEVRWELCNAAAVEWASYPFVYKWGKEWRIVPVILLLATPSSMLFIDYFHCIEVVQCLSWQAVLTTQSGIWHNPCVITDAGNLTDTSTFWCLLYEGKLTFKGMVFEWTFPWNLVHINTGIFHLKYTVIPNLYDFSLCIKKV